jgi:UDP-N-acetylglucosamine 4,6-dehydratase
LEPKTLFTANAQSILVTGGTGSFGQHFIERIIRDFGPRRLVVFSRDELKQDQMRQRLNDPVFNCIRYFIGDVRDKDRLYRAFDGIDLVVHAAALKQVPAAEYNPLEAIKTNVLGAANVIDAALDRGVKRVVALSTDKAANPVNLYGATKLCSDKLFVHARAYSTQKRTRFAVVRYGNVVGSRGSVVPLFLRQRKEKRLTITDERMTRFLITLEQGVSFVLKSIEGMQGGEIFVPKLPSARVIDVARAIAPDLPFATIGIRPGEKLHETMVPEDDSRTTIEFDDHFVILPDDPDEHAHYRSRPDNARRCPEGFRYSSDRNDGFLSVSDIRGLLATAGFLAPHEAAA